MREHARHAVSTFATSRSRRRPHHQRHLPPHHHAVDRRGIERGHRTLTVTQLRAFALSPAQSALLFRGLADA
jgi:hypothetical protein